MRRGDWGDNGDLFEKAREANQRRKEISEKHTAAKKEYNRVKDLRQSYV